MRRSVVIALATAVVVLLAIVVVTQLPGAGARRGPARQLGRMNPERPFAPRLSMSTEYHECTPAPAQRDDTVPRVKCGDSDAGSLDLAGLASSGNSTDPDLLRASGLAAMIWPDSKDDQALGDAISRLQKALRLSTRRVPLLVDLSAAHMVRAEREQNPYDLIAAIEYADEAVALEPRNLAARYNSALAKHAFGLDEEAAEAWDAYLALDSTSRWAEEARARKDSLITTPQEISRPAPRASTAQVDSFAANYPQEAREYGWLDVLPRWGAALEARDATGAVLLLRLAEELGRALKARSGGDASLADAVDAIRAARSDPEATLALARTHRAYAVGQAYVLRVEGAAALPYFESVARTRPSSRVLLQWNVLSHATAKYQAEKAEESRSDLRRLLTEVDSTRHPALMGRTRRMLGTILIHRGEAKREQFASAARHFARAGETEFEGDVLSLDGEAAYEEGDTVAAYQIMYLAQRALRPYRRSFRLHNQLIGLATYAARDGMPRAALAILDESVRVARREGTQGRLLDVLQRRSRVHASVGAVRPAALDWDSAYAVALRLPDDTVQQEWAKAALQLASPRSVAGAEMDAAVKALSGNLLWLVPALIRRADARIAEGDLVRASQDLEDVVIRVAKPSNEPDAALLEQARSSFDRLVMLYLRMGKPISALHTLERGRLSFAPRGDSAATGDVHLAAPAGHVALEYALIGDTLLTWVLRHDTLRAVRQSVDRAAFGLAVEQVSAALESPDAPIPTRALQRLYGLLIRPVRGYLGPAGTPLVILADGEVAGVPFAALMDGRRYLVEDYPLRYAATLEDAARKEPPRARAGPALLVADPAFDEGVYPMLFPLDWARTEVDSLLEFYPKNVLLRGDTATRDTFLASAQSASVIHYAGHAVFDDARPERSYLVLAGADTTGRVTAETVRGLRLRGVRLVVLSACRTLRAREGRSGGFAGLSGALLAAEAGGVVGSLWQVSDELTAPLMREFHAQFRDSGDPALALREAQLAMLRSEVDRRLNSPAAWAGFRYTGAQLP